jgi:SAM-dependent methyltransferase
MDPQLYRQFYDIEEHYWWSVGTRRLFFELVAPLLPASGARVLDVGCGTGITLREFPRPARLLCGSDLSPEALAFSRRRGIECLVRADVTALPFAGGAFDLVLALDVVEHVDADDQAVREMTRICRPGGHILIHVPAFPLLWSDKDDLNHHRRRYRRAGLRALVEGAGLRVRALAYFNCSALPAALAVALLQSARRGRAAPPDVAAAAAAVDRLYRIPPLLNRALTALLAVERRAVPYLPFGMSLVCLAQRTAAGDHSHR